MLKVMTMKMMMQVKRWGGKTFLYKHRCMPLHKLYHLSLQTISNGLQEVRSNLCISIDCTLVNNNKHIESTPQERERSTSPARARRIKLTSSVIHPRSYTVEAICAIAHPEPTHALATSLCTSHLLTGSEDGYIRDYDVFASVNGKTFLTAPQRQHCGVVEGTMKAGHLRMWWENPGVPVSDSVIEDHTRSSVTSLAMHSDALWALGGTEVI